jgi:hypothetical protein
MLMCDYSLERVASRPARTGDRLVTTGFPGTLARGFSAIDDPAVAVCLLPGTEVAFDKDVKKKGFWLSKSIGQRTAIFRQINREVPAVSHDALEFADGQVLFLVQLKEGQRATVLQLPVTSSGQGAEKARIPETA